MALTTCELHLGIEKAYCVIYNTLLIDVSTPSARTFICNRAFVSIIISVTAKSIRCVIIIDVATDDYVAISFLFIIVNNNIA